MLPTATFNEPQVISSLIKEASRICCFSNWYLSIKHLLKIILVLSLKTSSVSKVEFLSLNFTKICIYKKNEKRGGSYDAMITTKNNKSFNEEENFNRFKELNFHLKCNSIYNRVNKTDNEG